MIFFYVFSLIVFQLQLFLSSIVLFDRIDIIFTYYSLSISKRIANIFELHQFLQIIHKELFSNNQVINEFNEEKNDYLSKIILVRKRSRNWKNELLKHLCCFISRLNWKHFFNQTRLITYQSKSYLKEKLMIWWNQFLFFRKFFHLLSVNIKYVINNC